MHASHRPSRPAFSLIELLVVISTIAVLLSFMLPTLSTMRQTTYSAVCLAHQRAMGIGWHVYAADYDGLAMPLAYTEIEDVGSGDSIFWWGSVGDVSGLKNHSMGFLSPYLDSSLAEGTVYQCPSQPWGSYRPQGSPRTITSTYGYNGYYLTPAKTPGWAGQIGHRPWRRISDVLQPTRLLVFADTLLSGDPPSNNALLDPPMIYRGRGRWRQNRAPTTAFRHARSSRGPGSVVAVRADGSARLTQGQPEWIIDVDHAIGSLGTGNDPWYVPDWKDW